MSSSLVFRYPRSFAAAAILGIPILTVLSLVLSAASIWLLVSPDVSIGMKFDAAFVGTLGVSFGWITALTLRTWYSVLTTYVVDTTGIQVRFFSSSTFLDWERLEAARYRKLVGQLDLRFRDFPRLVVLTNVDRNWDRRTVLGAVSLVEQQTQVRVKRSAI